MKIVHGTLQVFTGIGGMRHGRSRSLPRIWMPERPSFGMLELGCGWLGAFICFGSCRMQMQLMASNGPIYVICTSWSGIAAGELALRC